MIEIKVSGSADTGNNEFVMMESGNKYFQPSAIKRVDDSPFKDTENVDYIINKIFDNMVISVSTTNPVIKDGMYLVGNSAISGDGSHREMNVGEQKKIESPVPYLMLLSTFSGIAIQKAKEEGKDFSKGINLKVNLAAGLPVLEYDKQEAEQFEKALKDNTYKVMVHLGYGNAVSVDVEFENVKIHSEASTIVFSLQADQEGNVREGEIFEEFQKDYKELLKKYYDINSVDGDFFEEKNILIFDIGDGTSELVVVNGLIPDQNNSTGLNRGAGHVINRNLDEIAKVLGLPIVMRHNVSKLLKDEQNIQAKRKRAKIIEVLETSLKEEAEQLTQSAMKVLSKVENNIDVVVVCGGGSILMKDHLKPALVEECDKREIPVLYVPKNSATTLYVEGLHLLLNSQELFETAEK